MLSRGTWYGLIACKPKGGHNTPSSIFGLSLLWKKAQKKEKKNKISEVINKIIPHRRPFITKFVWNPWKELSRDTSRHHWAQQITSVKVLTNIIWLFVEFIQNVVAVSIDIVEKLTKRGHGLGKTKWNGWCWFAIGYKKAFTNVIFKVSGFNFLSFKKEGS